MFHESHTSCELHQLTQTTQWVGECSVRIHGFARDARLARTALSNLDSESMEAGPLRGPLLPLPGGSTASSSGKLRLVEDGAGNVLVPKAGNFSKAQR